jgi:hypothetical protein
LSGSEQSIIAVHVLGVFMGACGNCRTTAGPTARPNAADA